jgi:hypothetical protein
VFGSISAIINNIENKMNKCPFDSQLSEERNIKIPEKSLLLRKMSGSHGG